MEVGKEVDDNLEEVQKLRRKAISKLNEYYSQTVLKKDAELAEQIRAEKRRHEG